MTDIPKRDSQVHRPANQRGAARLAAVQALYQMDVGRQTLEDTLAQFGAFHLGREIEGEQYLPADADFFRQIVRGVAKHQLEIDPAVCEIPTPAATPFAVSAMLLFLLAVFVALISPLMDSTPLVVIETKLPPAVLEPLADTFATARDLPLTIWMVAWPAVVVVPLTAPIKLPGALMMTLPFCDSDSEKRSSPSVVGSKSSASW